MLYEGELATAVARKLAVKLRNRHMRLVNDGHEIVREIVQQGERRVAGAAPVQRGGVVFHAVAEACLLKHFQVVAGAHSQTLGFQELAFGFKESQTLLQLRLYAMDGSLKAFLGCHIVAGGIDHDLFHSLQLFACHRVYQGQPLHFVAEQLHPHEGFLVGGVDVNRVASHFESASLEGGVVALVVHVDQLAQCRTLIYDVALSQQEHLLLVFVGRAQPVDARHRSHHNHIAPSEQG